MAFSVSHLQGEKPTSAHLARFERDVLSKRAKRREKSANDSAMTISELYPCDFIIWLVLSNLDSFS